METSKGCSYPECSVDGPIVVLYAPVEIRSCDAHWSEMYSRYLTGKKKPNVNLGQTMEKWTHVDKKTGRTINHKLSVGKSWEIENRRVSQDDGKTAINRITGKPAEY